MALTVGSLFSGIGGLDLGLERSGMRIIWNCETDPFACRVLAHHWPGVANLGDIRAVEWARVPRPAVLAGGFPCQDVSDAGPATGIEGLRSGLWAHFAEAVRQLRPDYVLVENVTGLLARGFGRVVGDLAASGYDAEWDCIPASAVGAAHLRARLFVLAYPGGQRGRTHDALQPGWSKPELCAWWQTEPDVDRVVDGVPARVARAADRRNGRLGNAVVPQVAEWLGGLIHDRERTCGTLRGAD